MKGFALYTPDEGLCTGGELRI